jgi:hypothetical protein
LISLLFLFGKSWLECRISIIWDEDADRLLVILKIIKRIITPIVIAPNAVYWNRRQKTSRSCVFR